MTPTEIDNLSLDELRIAVAERRGWMTYTYSKFVELGRECCVDPEIKVVAVESPLPDYPRSWHAAGELLNDFVKDWDVESLRTEIMPSSAKWVCVLSKKLFEYKATGDTAPEAICRAWLKATEERI